VYGVADYDIGCIHDRETDTDDFCTVRCLSNSHEECDSLPLRPMIDLLDPTKIFLAPEMVPETTTIRESLPATALSRASRVDTTTVSPSFPPEVLRTLSHIVLDSMASNSPAIQRSVANRSNIGQGGSSYKSQLPYQNG